MLWLFTHLALVILLNVPFGYWRAGTKKFSREWFLAIHLPVPFVFLVRVLSGYSLSYIPLFFTAFFAGQYLGKIVRDRLDES